MCSKKSFSERQAEVALSRAAKSKNPDRKEIRAYYCHHHQAWHLTSQDYNGEEKKVKLTFFERWKQLLKMA